jgi:hypothetical protein
MLFPPWREALIQAAVKDLETRARLAATGALFDGYNPQMEAVHVENAALLAQAFDAMGWPGPAAVGEDGASAAFLILQHAIGAPDLQRRGLALMLEAIPQNQANLIDAAYLTDRIAVFEGRAQLFGTQMDWGEMGELGPAPIKDPETVDQRRADIGLPPLADAITQMRARAAAEGETAPQDLAGRRAKFDAWAARVGWR